LFAVIGLVAVAAIEIHAWASGKFWPQFPIAFYGFSAYFVILTALNLQIVWKNKIVVGANDNLSACAALVLLAKHLTPTQPDDVEYVFVVTACEEAGTGGAWALAKEMRSQWDPRDTDIVVLDSIGGGELCVFQEGEMIPWRIPARLLDAARQAAGDDERFSKLFLFPLPAGATDALPFLAHGFNAIGLGRVDRRIGTPLHYHLASDTPDNLDFDQVVESSDYVALLARRLAAV
jgi:Zn-dependent M28 family amino/carboxypeptidase